MQPNAPDGYLGYRSLPIDQFKVTHRFSDPFWGRGPRWVERSSVWRRPIKALGWWVDPMRHRKYVGGIDGAFRENCAFVLEFMRGRGLDRDHVFLDLGCGPLRGGLHFIGYLLPRRYLGMDISAEVVRRGILRELGVNAFREKAPEFVISDAFEFRAFSKVPRYILAHSLFTHLPMRQVELCLANLRRFIGERDADFFTTFTEVETASEHDGEGHYLGGRQRLTYTQDEFHRLGAATHWSTEYVGVWGHPKDPIPGAQKLFRFYVRRTAA